MIVGWFSDSFLLESVSKSMPLKERCTIVMIHHTFVGLQSVYYVLKNVPTIFFKDDYDDLMVWLTLLVTN